MHVLVLLRRRHFRCGDGYERKTFLCLGGGGGAEVGLGSCWSCHGKYVSSIEDDWWQSKYREVEGLCKPSRGHCSTWLKLGLWYFCLCLCSLSCIQREDDDIEKCFWLQKVHDPRVTQRSTIAISLLYPRCNERFKSPDYQKMIFFGLICTKKIQDKRFDFFLTKIMD